MDGITWELSRKEGKIGTGNWKAFPKERLPELFCAAEQWKQELLDIDRPWLCWCVQDDWCYLQQQLVHAVGWTPVVGTDGSVARPKLITGAVFIDFNRTFQFPMMWMHFPLEVQFLFSKRLAFWHSDVLPPLPLMRTLAQHFDNLQDGSMTAVKREHVSFGQRIRRLVKRKPLFYKRWWEVVGCTTAAASQSQFQNGCGWWRYPRLHPNARSWAESAYQREHGVGIWLWMTHCGGHVSDIGCNIDEYHYSTNRSEYVRRWKNRSTLQGSKSNELNDTFDLTLLRQNLGFDLDEENR